MDLKAVDRIIDAVGSKHHIARASRAELGRALAWAGTLYSTNDAIRKSSAARVKRLSDALKATERLERALKRLKRLDLPSRLSSDDEFPRQLSVEEDDRVKT